MNKKAARLCILVFALPILSACSPAVDPTAGEGGIAPEPGETSAQEPAASGQPPSGQSSGGTCDNPYLPVVEGATWTSNLHTAEGDVFQVDTITDVGSDAFLVQTTQPNTQYVITWTCTAEGLLWLQTDGGAFSAVFPATQWQTNSYSGVSIPKDMQPGDTWTSSESLTAIDTVGNHQFDLNLSFQAIGMESVSVPAGTFNAMRVNIVMEWNYEGVTSTTNLSDWFAEGVGLVKSVTSADVSAGGYSLELVSYSIP